MNRWKFCRSINEYMNTLKQKLNRANGILTKLRYYVTADALKAIYYAFFDSHIIWDMHVKFGDQRVQNKALRITYLQVSNVL